MAKRLKDTVAFIPTLIALIVSLFIAVIVLAALYVNSENRPVVEVADSNPIVSLGMMEYQIEGDRAEKIDDEKTASLQKLLVEKAEGGLKHDNCQNPSYAVKVPSEDRNQALIGYGCGSTESPAFVVYEGSEWSMISPTNKFDNFKIPLCEYVDEHQINVDIAPVCVTVEGEDAVYTAR